MGIFSRIFGTEAYSSYNFSQYLKTHAVWRGRFDAFIKKIEDMIDVGKYLARQNKRKPDGIVTALHQLRYVFYCDHNVASFPWFDFGQGTTNDTWDQRFARVLKLALAEAQQAFDETFNTPEMQKDNSIIALHLDLNDIQRFSRDEIPVLESLVKKWKQDNYRYNHRY